MRKLKAYLATFTKYRGLIAQLVSRDLKTKYRRSILGFLWSLLNPLLTMLVLTMAFSFIMGNKTPNYHLHVLTGLLVYNFFSESTTLAMNSIVSNSTLINKVYIPKYVFPVSKIVFSFVNMLISLVAVIVVALFSGIPVTWSWLLLPLPLLYTAVFALGLGMFLSAITVFFRDILHLYGVLLQAWMYLTPIIYPMSQAPQLISFMKFNPLFHYVGYVRELLIGGTVPGLKANAVCLGIGLVALLIGVVVFYKKQDRFILYT
ncbi:ABC transporter permease [Clostridia bacterium OttesenSCG-928-F22]|nr:ABC transporter permease [Clostridia bacterium OttesenSCG-928-F22]